MSRRYQVLASFAFATAAVVFSADTAAAGQSTGFTFNPTSVQAGSSTTASGTCDRNAVSIDVKFTLAGGTEQTVTGAIADTETGAFSVVLSIPSTAAAQTVEVSGECVTSSGALTSTVTGRLTVTAAPPSTTTTTTTTTLAPTTTTTTAAPTTTAAAVTPTTAATTTTVPIATLPATGASSYSGEAAAIAASVLVLGFGLTVLARRRHAAGS